MAKEKWIPKDLKKGAFTKKAKAHGMGVQEYADKVLSDKSKASKRTKLQANLARTFSKMRR